MRAVFKKIKNKFVLSKSNVCCVADNITMHMYSDNNIPMQKQGGAIIYNLIYNRRKYSGKVQIKKS